MLPANDMKGDAFSDSEKDHMMRDVGKQYVVADILSLGDNSNIVICIVCDGSSCMVNDISLYVLIYRHCIINRFFNNE